MDAPLADDLRALIPQRNALVILGIQRSGTSLLAKDIAALGCLGTPGEHLVRVGQPVLPTPDQLRRFASAGASAGGDVFAVTLMVNYLDGFGLWLAAPEEQERGLKGRRASLEDLAIRFFRERFDRVTFVTLQRDPVWEMAYSHWRVTVTNQYHRLGAGVLRGVRQVTWQEGDPIVPDPAQILDFVRQIQEKRTRLAALIGRNGISPVALTYDEVTGSFPSYLTRLTDAFGLQEVDLSAARRDMLKLVPQAEIDAARTALRVYVGL